MIASEMKLRPENAFWKRCEMTAKVQKVKTCRGNDAVNESANDKHLIKLRDVQWLLTHYAKWN